MAHFRKRTGKSGKTLYSAEIRISGYASKTATFSKLKDAKAWATKIEGDMHAGKYLSDAAARQHTAGEMIDRYLADVLPVKTTKQGYIRQQRAQLLWWRRQIGDYQLIHVTPHLIMRVRDDMIKTGRKAGTINRYFAALSHVFTVARAQWSWVQHSPLSDVVRMAEPRGRVRFLTTEQMAALLEACRAEKKKVLHDIVYLALATGARKDELLSIRPSQVQLEQGRMILDETKNNERRSLSLSFDARRIVERRMECLKRGQVYLLPGKTRSQKARIDVEFRRACRRAGIEDFHFHDLRHTFASQLAMNGASLAEIAEALGHKTLNMVKRYAHLSESHTSEVVANMVRNSMPKADI